MSSFREILFTQDERKQVPETSDIDKAMENNFKSKYDMFINKVKIKMTESESELTEFIEARYDFSRHCFP